MEDPKFQRGQEVEAAWNNARLYQPAIIERVYAAYSYIVSFPTHANAVVQLGEDQIRLPRPSPEEAWKKATLLVGKRSSEMDYRIGEEAFNQETRHQVYQILGSAEIKISEQVKQNVRKLIEIASSL